MRRWSPTVGLVLLIAMLAGCQGNTDGDGDGLFDSTEKAGWLVLVDYLGSRVEYPVTSDPGEIDTDGDGISDFDEFRQGLDPTKEDTDEDGLTDCQELRHRVLAQCKDPAFTGPFDAYPTDPLNADSDPSVGRYWSNHGEFTDTTGSLGTQGANWGDGISDGDEILGYEISLPGGVTRTITTDPRNPDSDGDHLHDGEETLWFGTDPTVRDTEGDGCIDGFDPVPLRDEAFRPGLATFTLLQDQDAPFGKADVRLDIIFMDEARTLPASGSQRADVGEPVAIANLWPDTVEVPRCDGQGSTGYLTAIDPWVFVYAHAIDVDGNGLEVMDIYSRSGSTVPSSQGVWWHVRADRFNWERTLDAAFEGPVTFKGVDGELRFEPVVV